MKTLFASLCALALAVQAAQPDARSASWREALELDLPGEVVRAAEPLCAPGAACAEDGEALALFARALFATGAEARALELCARPLSEAQGAPALRLCAARLALERDELGRALELLVRPGSQPPEARDPERPEAELLLGRTLVRAARPVEARMHLERFVQLAPQDVEAPAALHMLTQIALDERDLVRARALREQARASAEWQAFYRTRRLQVREHPEDPLPRLGLAELWIAVQDWPRARAALEDLCARTPKFARAWSLLADLERFEQHEAAARAAYAHALELEPELPEARVGRGRLELAAGHAAAARADLERWAASPAANEPRFLEAHLDLARALLALGERAAAEARHARYRELGGAQPLDAR